jgi:hypothetical protein
VSGRSDPAVVGVVTVEHTEETIMSPAPSSLVVPGVPPGRRPVRLRRAADLSAPHTETRSYVCFHAPGLRVSLTPGDVSGPAA